MTPILLLNPLLYFAFIYETCRNTQNLTSDFLVMEYFKGKSTNVTLRCQNDWKIKLIIAKCLGKSRLYQKAGLTSICR